LVVRCLLPADYAAFSKLEGDPDVRRFTGPPSAIPRDRYERFVSVSSDACLAVCRKDNGNFIGRCGFRPTDDRVELEMFFLPDEQGHGFGGELFDAMIARCASAFPDLKIAATVSPANSHAIALLRKRSFTDSGERVLMKSGLEHALYVRTI
jgi:RimJ/RimL family protein N-acetyltransferase